MYRNIMVPVDGSPFSREAVFQGLRIASQSGATLRLVRVGSSSMLHGGPEGFAVENESLRRLHAAELADLYLIAAECRAHCTVSVTAALEHGPVIDALMGYAKRHQVDLIVMRSHARKGLSRAWFGSVADGLIRKSGIPVLVVRPPSVATALESSFQFKRILVPLDGSPLAEKSLEPAAALARIDGAMITLLRIVSPAKPGDDDVIHSTIGPARAQDVSAAQGYLNLLFRSYLDRSLRVCRQVVVSDDVAGSILRAAESSEADLIAIATRGRGAIARVASGSVANQILRDASVSAMVVHPTGIALEHAVFGTAAIGSAVPA